ncbi:phage tail tape measure protein [Rahnella aceris]|uniref:phage tail tape measure protein n=1 Tax=Rahnella sp. (strain Y9602) TaxID=2703885 RepID=UPI001C2667BB|nr:phage tail tape measure protein [Rahnella aceris]MBU9866819.1 phage tail tape measure protein [Rahnella aceris]
MADSFQLKAIITGVDKLSPVLDGIQKNIKKGGKNFRQGAIVASAMGVGIATAFAIPIKSAMDFESSMADVKKVVNFDTPQQFAEMSSDILDMSTQLPMAAKDIASIFAAGGQAGLAADQLKLFATDAVKMGVAFDQTAEESGQMMAQWRVSLGMTQTEVETLADQINYLGNTGPTTAAKISNVITRVGSLGKVAGFGADEIAALGSTIGASGIEADVAATAIKKVFTTLSSGSKMTKGQKGALKFLKINPKTLAADMQKDGKKALLQVFNQLSKVAPEKRVSILKTLFGEESVGAIAPLLSNLELLEDNFRKVGDASKYAGSMQKEYATRAGAAKNQVQLLENELNKINIITGDALLPAVSDGLQQAMPVLETIGSFLRDHPQLIKAIAGLAVGLATVGGLAAITMLIAAAGPIALMLGALVGAASYILMNWDQLFAVANPMQAKKLTDDEQRVSSAFNFNKPATSAGWGLLDTQHEVAANLKGLEIMRDLDIISGKFPYALTNASQAPAYDYGGRGSILNIANQTQQKIGAEMIVRFENAPPGMRVSEGRSSSPNVSVSSDVGYSPFSPSSLMR